MHQESPQKASIDFQSRLQAQTIQLEQGKKTLKKVFTLSLFFFLVAVSYASFSTVVIYIHQKYKHKGYGETYLTANSLTSVVTYIFCPFIIEKTKNMSKILLVACTLGYLLNMLIPTLFSYLEDAHAKGENQLPPSSIRFAFEIFANLIGGVSSGILAVLIGIYMANYTRNFQQNKKGKYFSINSVISNMRIIIGPMITMLGLGLGNQTIYFGILSLTVLVSLPIPLFLIPSINLTQTKATLASSINQDQNLQQQPSQQVKTKQLCAYLLRFIFYFRNVKRIIPFSIMAGLIVGFVASSLSHLLPPPNQGQTNDSKIAFALVFFGLGNVSGGYASGYVSDRFKLKIAGYLGCLLVIVGSITQAVCLSITPTLGRSSFVGFLSGLSYSYLFSYAAILCTIHYKGESFSFATNRQATSLSYIVYQWVVAFVNNKSNMQLNMTYQGLALIPMAMLAAICIKRECKVHQSNKYENESDSQLKVQKNICKQNLDKNQKQ